MKPLNLFERLFLSRESARTHAEKRIVRQALSFATPSEMEDIKKYNIVCSIPYGNEECSANVVCVYNEPDNFEYSVNLYRSMIHTNGEMFNFLDILKAKQTIQLWDCDNVYALYLEIKSSIAVIKDELDKVKRNYEVYAPFIDDGYMFDDILTDKAKEQSTVYLQISNVDAFILKAVTIGILPKELSSAYREYIIEAFRYEAKGAKVHSHFACWVYTPTAYIVLKPTIDAELTTRDTEDAEYAEIISRINN